MAGLSLFSVPALQSTPQTAVQGWATIFNRGKAMIPPVVVAAGLFYGYAASAARLDGDASWKGFAAAAVLNVVTVPFTIIAMNPTNETLLNAAKESSATAGKSSTTELIAKWARLNLIRSLLPLSGAVLGFATFLRRVV